MLALRAPVLVALAAILGCSAPRTPRYPAATPSGAGTPVAAPDLRPPPSLPGPKPPPPPPVRFTELPPLTFKPGPAIAVRSLGMQATGFVAMSPDGASWVAEVDDGPRLFTPRAPQGVALGARVPDAVFSRDGTRLLVWGFGASELSVVEVATGRILARREGQFCAARFASPNHVLFHDSSVDPTTRLHRLDVTTGAVTPLSLAHAAEYCRASEDGRLWLTDFADQRAFIDGTTGELRPLALPDEKGVVLARGASRFCLATERGFDCVRLPDERQETVWKRPTSDTVTWDPDGKFALIAFVQDPDGVYDHFAFVDFDAMTVRPLRNIKGRSGSLFAVHPGGQLISVGSGRGLYAYDTTRGRVRFAAHAPLYSHFSALGAPRRVVALPDDSGELFVIDVP